jgi:hypothetical protein
LQPVDEHGSGFSDFVDRVGLVIEDREMVHGLADRF